MDADVKKQEYWAILEQPARKGYASCIMAVSGLGKLTGEQAALIEKMVKAHFSEHLVELPCLPTNVLGVFNAVLSTQPPVTGLLDLVNAGVKAMGNDSLPNLPPSSERLGPWKLSLIAKLPKNAELLVDVIDPLAPTVVQDIVAYAASLAGNTRTKEISTKHSLEVEDDGVLKQEKEAKKKGRRDPTDNRTPEEREVAIKNYLIKKYREGYVPKAQEVADAIGASFGSVKRAQEWINRDLTKNSAHLQSGPVAKDSGYDIEYLEDSTDDDSSTRGRRVPNSLEKRSEQVSNRNLTQHEINIDLTPLRIELEALGVTDLNQLLKRLGKIDPDLRDATMETVKTHLKTSPKKAAQALVDSSKFAP